MPSKNDTSPAGTAKGARQDWAAPRVRRLLAGEAEFNPIIATDAEGTS